MIYDYVTAPNGTIHMVASSPAWTATSTVCGRDTHRADWIIGDETQSGIAATCGTCRRIVQHRNRRVAR